MTLHQTSDVIHKIIKWIIIFIVIIITVIMIFNISRMVMKILYPPPPDYPDVLFGKLAPVVFPESTVKEKFTYSIDTLSGSLPDLPDRIKVYKMEKQPVTLLNVKNARNKVSQIGFANTEGIQFSEIAISPTKFQWRIVSKELLRTIVMNTDTYDFRLTTSYRTYPPLFTQSFVATEEHARSVVQSFMNEMSLPHKDLDTEKIQIKSFALKSGVLIPAESVSGTQLMRLDYYQKDLNEHPVYYPYYPFSSMYFLIMARASGTDDILEANFFHQSVGTTAATYPLKTAAEAFDELKQGKAFISNYYGTSTSMPITDVTLGYYIGETPQDYTVPVILFQSKEEFFAFVPAIKNSCLTTSTTAIEECQGKTGKSKR